MGARWVPVAALIVLGAGLALSTSLADSTSEQSRELARERFKLSSERLGNDVQRRLRQPVYGLNGGRGMLATQPVLTRAIIQQYVNSRELDREFPGVRGIGFIERTTRAELPAFLERQRADDDPHFAVRSLSDEASDLYVITTIEPRARNQQAWGLDVGSEPIRREAVQRALRDDLHVAMTAPIPLVQDAERGNGVLVLVPTYDLRLPTHTVEERLAALRGFFYVPIVTRELFASIELDPQLGFELLDVSADAPTPLYTRSPAVDRVPLFVTQHTFDFGGRRLLFQTHSQPALEREVTEAHFAQRWIGHLLACACAAMVLLLGRSRERALAFAAERTAALQAATRDAEREARDHAWLTQTIDSHFLVSTTDKSGKILSANAAMCRVSGYSEAELLGQSHAILNSGEQPKGFWRQMWRTVASGQRWRAEVCNRAKDGQLYWVDTLIAPLFDEKGQINRYISVRADITARKEAEGALEAASLEAQRYAQNSEAANRAKSSFLATMSHEIRTPMNGVLGMTELLLNMGLTPEQEETARTVYRSADVLLVLLNDILDFSKIEAGKLEFERLPFDFEQLAHDTVDLFRGKVTGRNVELLVRVVPGTATQASGDPTRLRQIALNLVGNAVKFTKHGSVLIELEQAGHEFLMRVTDTGCGVPEELQARLFEPFTQADVATSRHHGGTGLGLAISRRLARGMGGELTMRSTLNVGTTFELRLPLAVAAVPSVAPRLAGRCVLVVEPSDQHRAILLEQLRAEGADARAVEVDHLDEALRERPRQVVLWADSVAPQHLPAGAGHVVQLRGTQRASQWSNTVHRPPTRQALVSAVLQASADGSTSTASRPALELVKKPEAAHVGLRALVADDNAINLKVARAMLERLGCEVTTVTNGAEAVERWAAARWDVVFMDCQMPELDGYEATAQIRAQEAQRCTHTLIVAMTANAGTEERLRCQSAGMDSFIAKPCRARDFEEVLRARRAAAA